MANNILMTNFNFFKYQILYPIAKFAPYESEKVVFSRIWATLSIHKKSCKVVLYNKKEKGFNNIQCNVVHIEIIRE
ncbi:MAG: hypothetical protein K1W37_05895 [Lachnospiraceae bacterium]